eukprot:2793005-Pyramimonas_sp.AAC.1
MASSKYSRYIQLAKLYDILTTQEAHGLTGNINYLGRELCARQLGFSLLDPNREGGACASRTLRLTSQFAETRHDVIIQGRIVESTQTGPRGCLVIHIMRLPNTSDPMPLFR